MKDKFILLALAVMPLEMQSQEVYYVDDRPHQSYYITEAAPSYYYRKVFIVERPRPVIYRSVRHLPVRTRRESVVYMQNTFQRSDYNRISQETNKKWFFSFDINSHIIKNREVLMYLIDYAKSNPYTHFYIDAYADAGTGNYEINKRLSELRAYAVINVLINEGIENNRINVKCHGSSAQVYNTNDLNRGVIVTTTIR
jgi:outer membrane protein OmpA-like peptidoglycan-associated protein